MSIHMTFFPLWYTKCEFFEEYSGLAFNTMTVDENSFTFSSFTLPSGSINDFSHLIALCEVKDEI